MTDFRPFECTGAPAGLDFRVEQPADWIRLPLPDETHDFKDLLHLAPLAVLMAPYAAVVFAVAARPAYANGTLAQWLDYQARQRGLDPGAIERQQVGPHAAVACWGVQVEDGAVMRSRLVLLEDGDRMVHISCMAPDSLWGSVAAAFERLLATFALIEPRGAKVPLAPPDLPLAEASTGPAPAAAAPVNEGKPSGASPGPLPLPDVADPDTIDGTAEATANDVALASDQASFDPEQALNARMRDNGVGLVPNVLDYHDQERWATLAPASLRATLRVPFGWHAIDDGRRLLVFDAAGHTQVSLQLFARGGRTDDQILAAKVPELLREWPRARHLRTEVRDLQCLLVRDAEVDGKPIEQAYLLRAAPDDLVLQVRVTSSPECFRIAGDLAEVLLRDLQFAGEPAV